MARSRLLTWLASRPDAAPALPAFIAAGGRAAPIVVRRNPRARRMTLKLDPAAGEARLTLPTRAKLADAAGFVALHLAWLEARVARLPAPRPFVPGAAIPFGDDELTLDWMAGRPRGVRHDGDRLLVGGPAEALPGRVRRWLAAQALATLAAETRDCAARLRRPGPRVKIGDPRGRWGSCSTTGEIRYSWRLILAPAWVRATVVAHECAHLVHADHSSAFWSLARELNPDHAAARRWLAARGAGLHWIGRAD